MPLWIYVDYPIQGQFLQLLHIPNNKEKGMSKSQGMIFRVV